MKHNGKKVVFSEEAKDQVIKAKDLFRYIEAGVITLGEIKDDSTREAFIDICDKVEACLEHIKSEVINND